jgi:hypothetical protein
MKWIRYLTRFGGADGDRGVTECRGCRGRRPGGDHLMRMRWAAGIPDPFVPDPCGDSCRTRRRRPRSWTENRYTVAHSRGG